jgi:hypothetical protein
LKLFQEGESGMLEGVNSSMIYLIYLIYCKSFCKSHNVLLPSTTIKQTNKNQQKNQKTKQLQICRPGSLSLWFKDLLWGFLSIMQVQSIYPVMGLRAHMLRWQGLGTALKSASHAWIMSVC